MRKIKKSLEVKEVLCVVYNRHTKEEYEDTFLVSDIYPTPILPDGVVVLEQKTLPGSKKEVVYSMTPEVFFKYATIEPSTEPPVEPSTEPQNITIEEADTGERVSLGDTPNIEHKNKTKKYSCT